LVQGVAEWLEAHGAASVAEIRGRMRAERLGEPQALFRANYRQTLLFGYPRPDTDLGNLVPATERPAAKGARCVDT
jgi:dihydroorotate dehydrogenase (fumarate)